MKVNPAVLRMTATAVTTGLAITETYYPHNIYVLMALAFAAAYGIHAIPTGKETLMSDGLVSMGLAKPAETVPEPVAEATALEVPAEPVTGTPDHAAYLREVIGALQDIVAEIEAAHAPQM